LLDLDLWLRRSLFFRCWRL